MKLAFAFAEPPVIVQNMLRLIPKRAPVDDDGELLATVLGERQRMILSGFACMVCECAANAGRAGTLEHAADMVEETIDALGHMRAYVRRLKAA